MSYGAPSSSRPEAELLDNVDYDRAELSKMYRMLGNLAKSIVPSTRKKRDESSKDAERRRELRESLEDMGADEIELRNKQISQSPSANNGLSQERFLELIRRKAVESTRDAQQASRLVTRTRSHISQLSSTGITPRHLNSMLELLHALAFTSDPTSLRASSQTQPRATSQQEVRAVSQATTARYTDATDTPASAEPHRISPPNGIAQPSARSSARTSAQPSLPTQPESSAKAKDIQAVSVKSLVQSGEQVTPSELLQRFRAQLGKQQIAEDDLLRDMIYIMQGINGTHVKLEEEFHFQPNADPAEAASGPSKILRVVFNEGESGYINPPTKRIIHRLAELGQLCNRVSRFRLEREKMTTMGSVMKSLCCFISDELAKFYGLIGHLDDQVKASHSGKTQNYITLKRLAQLTEEMTLRFRLMSTIIESCQDAHGGALISLIHSYTFNGDPFIRRFTSRLLDEVSKPFFLSLSLWIYEGELQDPFQEFFVELNANPHSSGQGRSKGEGGEAFSFSELDTDAASLWQNKFLFRKEMLPSFLQESFGRKIFSTGKSLNFIRQSCGDGGWVAKRRQLAGAGVELRYTDMTGLESTIEQAFTSASKRLLDIFLDDFKLLDHLRALKDYLMLSRGDFVDMLMTSLGPSLNRPANSLFRHNLTASLETAVRGSNAQFDEADIVRRLDARILEFSTGDTGWDTFTLEYKVDSPVNTVLDNQAMVGYQIIFSHLWKVKRVELALNSSWLRLHETGSSLRRIKTAQTRKTATRDASEVHEVTLLLTRVEHWMVKLQEMVQFVRQMQGFAQLEVIEYSWHDLLGFFSRRQGDLDELIQGHRAYLNALIGKVLLRGGGKSHADESADYLAVRLRAQLDTVLSFTLAVGDLTHHVTREVARYDMSLGVQPSISERGARSRTASAMIPPVSTNSQLAPADPQILVAIYARLTTHSDTFALGMKHLLYDLERHTNLTVRDLAVRLNFNDRYDPISSRDTRAKAAPIAVATAT